MFHVNKTSAAINVEYNHHANVSNMAAFKHSLTFLNLNAWKAAGGEADLNVPVAMQRKYMHKK